MSQKVLKPCFDWQFSKSYSPKLLLLYLNVIKKIIKIKIVDVAYLGNLKLR